VQQALMSCHWKRMKLVSPGGDGGGGGDIVDERGVDFHS
jgi:hypothetical protein